MKALVLDDYNKLVYRDMPDPQPNVGEVLVRVKACGICGSDVHGMDGSTGRRQPPLIMGHEASGEIVGVGQGVTRWKAGDRVTFDSTVYPLDDWFTLHGRYNLSEGREVIGVSPVEYKRHGAFAEYLTVPQHILYRIPESVGYEQAAMVEPAAVAAHAVKLSGIQVGDSAIVFGCGMIGTFIISMLKTAGATQVIAVDIDGGKLKTAKNYGASLTVNSAEQDVTAIVKQHTKGRGADFGFEAIGISSTVNAMIDTLRKGATAVLVGNITPKIEFPLQKIVTQEIKIQGSCAINGEYEMVLDMIAGGTLNVDDMISAVAPLSEGAEWFRRLYNRESNLNKVILVP
ncbi:MAG: galactitol-1-phosphate 5-dehydrogenase [Tannerella sp.]|jgi:L-iditol 2-dehydrogenase|nr:galactitol-1-phosphate 5-dehydrogenase [Tannerella sp.]